MYSEERQQAIATQVATRGRVSVQELAKEFGVTSETIRRDLSTLESMQLLRRVHGGALVIGSATMLESALGERAAERSEEKQRIASVAVGLLPSGGATILLDAGTTTVRMTSLLPQDRHYMVYTHSITVASALAEMRNVELHLLPGRVRRKTHAAVGVETVAAIARIRVDVAFLGTNGLTVRHGCSTPDDAEAATKAAMVAAANRTVVLADHSKLGQESTICFAPLDQVDTLVTDAGSPASARAELTAAGLEVMVA